MKLQTNVRSATSDLILFLSQNNFVSLEEVTASGDFIFSFKYRISLTSKTKKLTDYNKIVVTAFKPQQSSINIDASPQYSANISQPFVNTNSNVQYGAVFQLFDNYNIAKIFPDNVAEKLYQGASKVASLSNKEEVISSIEEKMFKLLTANNVKNNLYRIVDVVPLSKKENRLSFDNPVRKEDLFDLDVSRMLTYINRERISVLSPVENEKINSNTNFLNNTYVSKNGQFLSKLSKYYLSDIKPSQEESNSIWYGTKISDRNLPYIESNVKLKIPAKFKDSNIGIRFELFKNGKIISEENIVQNINILEHYLAYVEPLSSPLVYQSYSPGDQSLKVNLLITEKQSNKSKITGYNIYEKKIDEKMNVQDYVLLESISAGKGSSHFSFSLKSKFSNIRVVSLDHQNKETCHFTDVIVGKVIDNFGKIIIDPKAGKNKNIVLDIFNIPKQSRTIKVYKRLCSSLDIKSIKFKSSSHDADNKFQEMREIARGFEGDGISSVTERQIPGRIHEYYVAAFDKNQKILAFSDIVCFKHPEFLDEEKSKSLRVSISNQSNSFDNLGRMSIKFDINSVTSKESDQKTYEYIKSQLGEIYSAYLDPQNNQNNAVDKFPNLGKLINHQIIRLNLSTGEREAFREFVSDGTFSDDPISRKINGVSPLNPQHDYEYHVNTYKSNPINLFKNYIVHKQEILNLGNGVTTKKDLFYSPYKWKSPGSKNQLHAEDDSGVPILDIRENLTEEDYGETATYSYKGLSDIVEVSNVQTYRIDAKTIKIAWTNPVVSAYSQKSLYDSFVVIKSVNGLRTFLGKTQKNYMFHRLTAEDLGTIYYIIVPITHEFDIDNPAYSGSLFIDSDGITEKTKL